VIQVGAQVRFAAVARVTIAVRRIRGAHECAFSGLAIIVRAIGMRPARHSEAAFRAIGTATVDVALATIGDEVVTGRLGAGLLPTHARLAIRSEVAAFAHRARLTGAAAAVLVGFVATLLAIATARTLTRAVETLAVSAIGRAVAALAELARRARAATVQVRLAFVGELVLAVRRMVDEFELRRAA